MARLEHVVAECLYAPQASHRRTSHWQKGCGDAAEEGLACLGHVDVVLTWCAPGTMGIWKAKEVSKPEIKECL